MAKKKELDNPFVNDLQIWVSARPLKDTVHKTGEGVFVPAVSYVEIEPVTRLYKDPNLRRVIALMSERAKGMMLWIMYKLKSGQDTVCLDVNLYNAELIEGLEEHERKGRTVCKKTFYAVLRELREYNVIAPSMRPKWYWINPKYFFAGSRRDKYPSKVVIKHNKNL